MIWAFPTGVPKFDEEGNPPLHMVAATGNSGMMGVLGGLFGLGRV